MEIEKIIKQMNGITYKEWCFLKDIVESNFKRQLNKSSFKADEKTLKSLQDNWIY